MANPKETLNKIYEYLEIEKIEFKGNKLVESWNANDKEKQNNKTEKEIPTTASEHIREQLKNIYKPEIRALENMVGWDCENWLT